MTSWARTVPALDRPDDPQHVEPVPPDLLEVDAAASRGVERAVVRPGRAPFVHPKCERVGFSKRSGRSLASLLSVAADKAALEALYDATDGSNWTTTEPLSM